MLLKYNMIALTGVNQILFTLTIKVRISLCRIVRNSLRLTACYADLLYQTSSKLFKKYVTSQTHIRLSVKYSCHSADFHSTRGGSSTFCEEILHRISLKYYIGHRQTDGRISSPYKIFFFLLRKIHLKT